jgi:hypothetical protein
LLLLLLLLLLWLLLRLLLWLLLLLLLLRLLLLLSDLQACLGVLCTLILFAMVHQCRYGCC